MEGLTKLSAFLICYRVKETPQDMNEAEKVKFDSCEQTLEGENEERRQFTPPIYSLEEEWVVDYIEQFGNEPSFF